MTVMDSNGRVYAEFKSVTEFAETTHIFKTNYEDRLRRGRRWIREKAAGKGCENCGQPIDASLSACCDYPTCFPCFTGESDSSYDYEIVEEGAT